MHKSARERAFLSFDDFGVCGKASPRERVNAARMCRSGIPGSNKNEPVKGSFCVSEKGEGADPARHRLPRYLMALSAAMAPSAVAVTIWRRVFFLTSPAANTPGRAVLISSSVTM